MSEGIFGNISGNQNKRDEANKSDKWKPSNVGYNSISKDRNGVLKETVKVICGEKRTMYGTPTDISKYKDWTEEDLTDDEEESRIGNELNLSSVNSFDYMYGEKASAKSKYLKKLPSNSGSEQYYSSSTFSGNSCSDWYARNYHNDERRTEISEDTQPKRKITDNYINRQVVFDSGRPNPNNYDRRSNNIYTKNSGKIPNLSIHKTLKQLFELAKLREIYKFKTYDKTNDLTMLELEKLTKECCSHISQWFNEQAYTLHSLQKVHSSGGHQNRTINL